MSAMEELDEKMGENLNLKDHDFTTILKNDDLFVVFTYLEVVDLINVYQVCQRWNVLAKKVLASKRILKLNLITINHDIAMRMIKFIGDALRELEINYLDEFHLLMIANFCPNLQKFSLSESILVDNTVNYLVSKCNNLREVVIEHCTGITDDGVFSLLQGLSQLQKLTVSVNCVITLEMKTADDEDNLPKFENLISLVARDGLWVSNEGCLKVISICPNLEILDVSGCWGVDTSLILPCLRLIQQRPERKPLQLVIGRTNVYESMVHVDSNLLKLDLTYTGHEDHEEEDNYYSIDDYDNFEDYSINYISD